METLLICFFYFATQEALHARYSHVSLPAHGTIHKKTLYGFFGKKGDDSGLDAIAIDNPPKVRTKVYQAHVVWGDLGINFRHHIAYDSIWISTNIEPYRLNLAELELFNSKNWKAFFEKYPDSTPHQMFTMSLWCKYGKIAENQMGGNWSLYGYPTDVLGFGNAPISETSVKSYILSKTTKQLEVWDSQFVWDAKTKGIEGRFGWEPKGWRTKPSARFEKIGQWIADLDNNDFQKRAKASEELEKLGDLAKPALTKLLASKPPVEVRRCAQMLLDNRNSKSEGLLWDADNYEKIPSLFAEDFYFFLRKNDYYFVTQSGKLYHALPRKEGDKARIMKELWGDAKRPIVAVIEDADRDKVWLFAKDKNAGAKRDFYFEMKEMIKAESFDPAKLRPVNIEGRAKLLLEYLPLISADSKK